MHPVVSSVFGQGVVVVHGRSRDVHPGRRVQVAGCCRLIVGTEYLVADTDAAIGCQFTGFDTDIEMHQALRFDKVGHRQRVVGGQHEFGPDRHPVFGSVLVPAQAGSIFAKTHPDAGCYLGRIANKPVVTEIGRGSGLAAGRAREAHPAGPSAGTVVDNRTH